VLIIFTAAVAIALITKILEFRMCIGWLVNAGHFVTTSPFRNSPHLPTTQCACADLEDFARQRNGGGGRAKCTIFALNAVIGNRASNKNEL
jgi:hypothetical protein